MSETTDLDCCDVWGVLPFLLVVGLERGARLPVSRQTRYSLRMSAANPVRAVLRTGEFLGVTTHQRPLASVHFSVWGLRGLPGPAQGTRAGAASISETRLSRSSLSSPTETAEKPPFD